MNKPICYVGVDVGQAELWVAAVDRRPRRFAHTAAGVRSLVRFCRQAAPDHVLHVCMEATGVYGRSPAVQLLEDGAELQVSPPQADQSGADCGVWQGAVAAHQD